MNEDMALSLMAKSEEQSKSNHSNDLYVKFHDELFIWVFRKLARQGGATDHD